jgi:ATP-dependent Clp protease ATP-binding subunit ClpA
VFEYFTETGVKVIMLAHEEARGSGHRFVGSDQLMLGLIALGEGLAFEAINHFGITLEEARVAVQMVAGRGSDFETNEILFTSCAKRSLELAWNQARELRHNFIATEHILLGLIQEEQGLGPQVLVNLGVDLLKLRHYVLEQLLTRYERASKAGSADYHDFGCAARVLFLLERFEEAKVYFREALLRPGGEHYRVDADACISELEKRRETD